MSKPDWWPPNPHYERNRRGQGFEQGVYAGIWAVIARYEALINDPKCPGFREALEQLKREVG